MIAIIDGDIPIFTECAVAAGRGNVFGSYFPDIDALADSASKTIEYWAKQAQADDIILVHSHESRRNFRKHLLPEQYKAQRAVAKPLGYYDVLAKVLERFHCEAIDGIEGDDTCGILHTSPLLGGDTVTVSTDKDFKTIPGLIFNPNKQVEPEMVTANEATHFWMQQVLEGDSADGYKGAKGIGKVKALKAIGDVDNTIGVDEYIDHLWEKVIEVYAQVYSDYEAENLAVTQARMARILHRDDYLKESNEIKLWHPKGATLLKLDSF